jgi:DNA-binding LacI/PurR family transcriptional regulator
MKTSLKKVVAVAFDQNLRYSSEIFRGVADYAAHHHLDWRLLPLGFDFEEPVMDLAASGQLRGVIGSFISDRWIGNLRQPAVHAVNLFQLSRIHSVPTVCVDDVSIGDRAARHLAEQAARSFAFFGPDNLYSTQLRREGFSAALPEITVVRLRHGAPLRHEVGQLDGLAKPVGVFCGSDHLARALILEARRQGWRVGQDLLVLGSDNDPSESIFAEIGISSFHLPAHEIGYTAARRLSEQESGLRPDPSRCFVSAPRLIARESTLPPGPARTVQHALNYFEEKLSDPALDIGKLCRGIGVSRRSLELAFQKERQTSPYRQLSAYRLEKARQSLTQTQLPVEAVGQSCGYPEPHHFSAWFKKQSGMAPKPYREAHRSHPR